MVMRALRRCARTPPLFCIRAISCSSPASSSSSSFFLSDDEEGDLQDRRFSASISLSDEEDSGSCIKRLKTLEDPHLHGWITPAQTLIPQHNTISSCIKPLKTLEDRHPHRLIRPVQTPTSQLNTKLSAPYWPPPSLSSSSFSFSDDEDNHSRSSSFQSLRADNTISVFWDLDNKPPHSVPPYEAAIRLREVACSFGRLVDMVAYANRHAFSYLPSYVKDERRHRKELDRLEVSGLVVPTDPYVCGYCGRKCKTNMALKKHFKQLHERERNKRLNRLDSLKGKKKIKYKQSLTEKETRYREASRDIITPKVGYGLMQELKRAGVWVKMVSDRPQAADEALMQHISQSIHTGIKCICLVSDDSDFLPVLHEARAQHLHTVVVGDKPRLKMFADIQFSWADLASGQAFDRAAELATIWYANKGLGKSSLRAGPCPSRKAGVRESKNVPLRTHDFQDWDVSDVSDIESQSDAENVVESSYDNQSDAENRLESSSGMWLSEDGDVDDDADADADADPF